MFAEVNEFKKPGHKFSIKDKRMEGHMRRYSFSQLNQLETNRGITEFVWAEYFADKTSIDRCMKLLLENNQIGSFTYAGCDSRFPGTVSKIACACLQHPGLIRLELIDNHIGWEGMLALASLVQNNQKLASLQIKSAPAHRYQVWWSCDQQITISRAFREAIASNTTLLEFRGPSLMLQEDLEAIQVSLKRNLVLRTQV